MASRMGKPTYLGRKRRRRIRFEVLIPLLAVVVALGFGAFKLISGLFTEEEKMIEYSLEGLTVEESKLALTTINNEDGEFELVDYLLYGESLMLYADTYELAKKDELTSKSIMCRNLATGSEYVYYMGSLLDEGIPIYELPVGVYEVYVSSLMSDQRMYMSEETLESFYSVTRKGINRKFTLMADTNYFYEHDPTLDLEKPYLFFIVEDAELPEEYYDIVIDPGHFAYDCYSEKCTGWIDNGSVANNGKFIESIAVYDVSLVVKRELEAAGLKVMITRDDVTPVDMYGVDGRVYKSIQAQAKYFISNHLNSINDKRVHGTEVWHSRYASTTFAETILNSLVDNTILVASGNIGGGNKIPSVITSTVSGYDKPYDGYMMIREPGGKGTAAGQISQAAQVNNAPFLEGVNYGAEALLVEYIYMTNKDDADNWDANYEEYGKAVAKGIIEYLNLDFYDNDFISE